MSNFDSCPQMVKLNTVYFRNSSPSIKVSLCKRSLIFTVRLDNIYRKHSQNYFLITIFLIIIFNLISGGGLTIRSDLLSHQWVNNSLYLHREISSNGFSLFNQAQGHLLNNDLQYVERKYLMWQQVWLSVLIFHLTFIGGQAKKHTDTDAYMHTRTHRPAWAPALLENLKKSNLKSSLNVIWKASGKSHLM